MKNSTENDLSVIFSPNFLQNFQQTSEDRTSENSNVVDIKSISNLEQFHKKKSPNKSLENSFQKSKESTSSTFLKKFIRKDLNTMSKYSLMSSEIPKTEENQTFLYTINSTKKESNNTEFNVNFNSEMILSPTDSRRKFFFKSERAQKNWEKLRLHVAKIRFGIKTSSLLHSKTSKIMSGYAEKKTLIKARYKICLFSHKNLFIIIWNKLTVFLFLHYMFILPERIANRDRSPGFYKYCLAMDIVHMLDIVLQLSTEKKTNNGILRSHRKIFLYQLKNYLVFDFISCLPLFLINPRFMRIKYCKLVKIGWFFKKISSIFYLLTSKLCSMFLSRKELEMYIVYLARAIFSSLIIIFWLAHFFGTSFSDIVSSNEKNENEPKIPEDQKKKTHPYLQIIYLIVLTLAQVGYDGFCDSSLEMFFMCLVMFFGICLFGYVMGNVSQIIKNLNYFSKKIEDKEDIEMWLLYRENSNPIRNIPVFLSEKIRNYVLYMNTLNFSEVLHYASIFELLRPDIRKEIIMSKMNHIFETFGVFFQNIPFEMKEEILASFQPLVIPTNTTIIQRGQMSKGIYFIVQGKCYVSCLKGFIFCKLKKGNYFGDACLLKENSPYFFFSHYKSLMKCLFVPYFVLKKLEKNFYKECLLLKYQAHLRFEYYFMIKKNARDRFSYFKGINMGIQELSDDQNKDNLENKKEFEDSFDENFEENDDDDDEEENDENYAENNAEYDEEIYEKNFEKIYENNKNNKKNEYNEYNENNENNGNNEYNENNEKNENYENNENTKNKLKKLEFYENNEISKYNVINKKYNENNFIKNNEENKRKIEENIDNNNTNTTEKFNENFLNEDIDKNFINYPENIFGTKESTQKALILEINPLNNFKIQENKQNKQKSSILKNKEYKIFKITSNSEISKKTIKIDEKPLVRISTKKMFPPRRKNRGITVVRRSTRLDPAPKKRNFFSFITEKINNSFIKKDEEDCENFKIDENEEILNYFEIKEKKELEEELELIDSEDEPYFLQPEFEENEENSEKYEMEIKYVQKKILCLENNFTNLKNDVKKSLNFFTELTKNVDNKY